MSSNPSLESDTCAASDRLRDRRPTRTQGLNWDFASCSNSMLNITSIFFDIMVALALTTSRAAGTSTRD